MNPEQLNNWIWTVGLQLIFLHANEGNPDLDTRYYAGVVDQLVKAMPVEFVIAVDEWLTTEAGIAFLNHLRFQSIVAPYNPEGKYDVWTPGQDKDD